MLSSTVFAQRESAPPIYTIIRDSLGVSGGVSMATTANGGLYTHQGALGAITGGSVFEGERFVYSVLHGSIVQTNSIRGTINDADATPITDVIISVQAYIGDPCGDHQLVAETFVM